MVCSVYVLLNVAWRAFARQVALLLERGADVTARDPKGNTLAHYAAGAACRVGIPHGTPRVPPPCPAFIPRSRCTTCAAPAASLARRSCRGAYPMTMHRSLPRLWGGRPAKAPPVAVLRRLSPFSPSRFLISDLPCASGYGRLALLQLLLDKGCSADVKVSGPLRCGLGEGTAPRTPEPWAVNRLGRS